MSDESQGIKDLSPSCVNEAVIKCIVTNEEGKLEREKKTLFQMKNATNKRKSVGVTVDQACQRSARYTYVGSFSSKMKPWNSR